MLDTPARLTLKVVVPVDAALRGRLEEEAEAEGLPLATETRRLILRGLAAKRAGQDWGAIQLYEARP